MDLHADEPALNAMAERIAVVGHKGVPRHDQPAVRRYYETATVIHIEVAEGERDAVVEAAQASQAAISWDYLDGHPRFVRLVYLGVAFPPRDEAVAALQLACALRQGHSGAARPMGIGMGRLFYKQDQESSEQRNMAGLLLQVLIILATASRQDGHILINDALYEILQDRVKSEEIGLLENEAGISLKAYRFLGET